jgi:hypothetical protein
MAGAVSRPLTRTETGAAALGLPPVGGSRRQERIHRASADSTADKRGGRAVGALSGDGRVVAVLRKDVPGVWLQRVS